VSEVKTSIDMIILIVQNVYNVPASNVQNVYCGDANSKVIVNVRVLVAPTEEASPVD
jgi:hypothetical protein